jgi:hypothetical protein
MRRNNASSRSPLVASRNRVNRLCSQQRLWAVHARKRGLTRKPGPPVHDDLVLRDFTAPEPNVLSLTVITEPPTAWFPAVVAALLVRGVCDAGEEVHRRPA